MQDKFQQAMQSRSEMPEEDIQDNDFAVVDNLVAEAYAKYSEEEEPDLQACLLELAENIKKAAMGDSDTEYDI